MAERSKHRYYFIKKSCCSSYPVFRPKWHNISPLLTSKWIRVYFISVQQAKNIHFQIQIQILKVTLYLASSVSPLHLFIWPIHTCSHGNSQVILHIRTIPKCWRCKFSHNWWALHLNAWPLLTSAADIAAWSLDARTVVALEWFLDISNSEVVRACVSRYSWWYGEQIRVQEAVEKPFVFGMV